MKFYVNNYNNPYNNGHRTNWANVQSKYPALNIIERKNEYTVEVELPGFTINDINIKLEKHVLRISSKENKTVDSKSTQDDKTYLIKERVKKEFKRSLSLGDDVDEDKLSASLKNGLLIITLPKVELSLPRSIDVAVV